MGIRLVPQRAGDRVVVHASDPTFIVPTEAAVVDVRAGASAIGDRASFVVVPASSQAIVDTKSPVARILILSASDALLATVVRTYGGEIEPRRLNRYLATPQSLPRTNWLNEICHRYLFERAVCRKRDNDATRFLETEIVKEVYFLCHERDTVADRASVVDAHGPLVQRAVRAIEERLFEDDVVRRLGRICGASSSTLLRAFKRELRQGPLAYVRARRLDEALLFLKSRRFAVGEIATIVGYGNFAAFSHAFRARFGVRPSDVRPDASAAPTTPPVRASRKRRR